MTIDQSARDAAAVRVWPTRMQNRVQAMFDADTGTYRADFHNGLELEFCGECGRKGSTNPDVDLCSDCEAALRAMKGQNDAISNG